MTVPEELLVEEEQAIVIIWHNDAGLEPAANADSDLLSVASGWHTGPANDMFARPNDGGQVGSEPSLQPWVDQFVDFLISEN